MAPATPQTVLLGPVYRRITGTQESTTNKGAAASGVTIAPQEALLLDRTK